MWLSQIWRTSVYQVQYNGYTQPECLWTCEGVRCFVSSTNGGRCTFVIITHEWLKSCTKAFHGNSLQTDPGLWDTCLTCFCFLHVLFSHKQCVSMLKLITDTCLQRRIFYFIVIHINWQILNDSMLKLRKIQIEKHKIHCCYLWINLNLYTWYTSVFFFISTAKKHALLWSWRSRHKAPLVL